MIQLKFHGLRPDGIKIKITFGLKKQKIRNNFMLIV